ncbi:MAG: cytochrome C oxidase Cbb3 [Cyclobacteriaceae bacterium]|nr:cytochrome C oxidase Cbb3 [Cyclobacteriaceae bacterium]
MFKHYFEGIDNVAVGPVISLIIFFVFFILLILWVLKVDEKYIVKMKNMPIEPNSESVSDQN